jgi:DNA-binding NtrC family response regulator
LQGPGSAGPPVRHSDSALGSNYDNGPVYGGNALPGSMHGVHEGPRPHQSFDLDRPLREARDAFEKSYFEFHLMKEGGSMTRVAEKTGLERTHLYRKLKQLGVDLARNKRGG